MKWSLCNLFRNSTSRAAAPIAGCSARTTRLEVESLEDRAVPTMNLTGYSFSMPAASLYVSQEIGTQFWGSFFDAKSGIAIPVTGQLNPIGNQLDAMSFHGSGMKGLESEQVVFNGKLHEGPAPLMFGQVTERYQMPVAIWMHSEFIESVGHVVT
jgi:hypothetical protein